MATSNFRIKKICEWCGKEFEAQKVSTKLKKTLPNDINQDDIFDYIKKHDR